MNGAKKYQSMKRMYMHMGYKVYLLVHYLVVCAQTCKIHAAVGFLTWVLFSDP